MEAYTHDIAHKCRQTISDKWPLLRGFMGIWDPKRVAIGRVRGVAVGKG